MTLNADQMKPKSHISSVRLGLAALIPAACFLLPLPTGVAQASTLKTLSEADLLAQAATTICPAQLGGAIDRITQRPSLAGVRWGILVQTVDHTASRKTLFARNATTLLAPASNNKLLTTAAALKALGAQYRFRTAVYGDRNSPNLTTLRLSGAAIQA